MDDTLGADYASPTVGWGVLHDLPNHLLGVAATSTCGSVGPFECARRDRRA